LGAAEIQAGTWQDIWLGKLNEKTTKLVIITIAFWSTSYLFYALNNFSPGNEYERMHKCNNSVQKEYGDIDKGVF